MTRQEKGIIKLSYHLDYSEFIKALEIISSPYHLEIKHLEEASLSIGKDPKYHQILFPDGLYSIKEYYEQLKDTEMLNLLCKKKKPQKIRDRISLGIKTRIIELGYRKHTNHNCIIKIDDSSIKSAWRTCDNIWKYAGDNSTDFY